MLALLTIINICSIAFTLVMSLFGLHVAAQVGSCIAIIGVILMGISGRSK